MTDNGDAVVREVTALPRRRGTVFVGPAEGPRRESASEHRQGRIRKDRVYLRP